MTTPFNIDIKAAQVSCRSCSLSELCLPRGLNETELAELDNAIERKHKSDPGSYLFHAGDPLHKIYAVRSGSFKAVISSSDGSEQIIGFYLAGELLGLDGLADERHTCSVIALENSTVCEVPFQNFETLCGQLDGLRKQIMHLIGRVISHDHELILSLGQKNADERFATFLLSMSQRYKQRGFSEYEFNLAMTRHEIANYLGLAVETTSRLFSRFQAERLLDVKRRHLRILDLPALQKLANVKCKQV